MRQLTLRARLTLIYGGLFVIAGVLLLGVTYALFSQKLAGDQRVVIRGTYLNHPPPALRRGAERARGRERPPPLPQRPFLKEESFRRICL